MEKMFNFISVIVGLVGGFIVSLFGGWDVMLYTILLFAILDYFTGILKAVYKKELSSASGFKGDCKKNHGICGYRSCLQRAENDRGHNTIKGNCYCFLYLQ